MIMGKGHKKKTKDTDHKGEGVDEKPLPKLVLKVGKEHKKHKGENSESAHHADVEHSSHHKKKKKKHHKHRGEQEKEKEKDRERDKEKKSRKRELVQDSAEPETPSKKLHLRIHNEKEKKPEPKEQELSPFRLCAENILRNLQRKDVYNIFQFPVSDAVAPGYSKIIKHPMDFLTMSLKVEKGEYTSLEQLKSDFVLMCNNAMLYNGPETIYYKSADKMLSIGLKMLSKDKLHKMKRSLGVPVSDSEDDMVQFEDDDVNIMDPVNTSADETVYSKRKQEKKKKNKDKENRNIVESILAAAHEARRQLLEQQPNQLYGYIEKDKEGNNSFNILNPDTTEDTKYRPLTLEKLAPRPQEGQPAGQISDEKKCKVVPVNYLLYGPYGSFGPTYDSSLSSTTKEDSDLLLKTYGSEFGLSYAKSLKDFTSECSFSKNYVDRILDTITDGAHSKLLKQQKEKELEESNKENKESGVEVQRIETTDKDSIPSSTTEIDIESLLSLDDLGINVSFLKDIVGNKDKTTIIQPSTVEQTQQKQQQQQGDQNNAKAILSQNADLLQALQDTQFKRLSKKHGGTAEIEEQELKIATSLTDNLKEMMKVTTPKDVVSAQSVKKAIGNNDIYIEEKEAAQSKEKKDDALDLSFEESTNEQPIAKGTNG